MLCVTWVHWNWNLSNARFAQTQGWVLRLREGQFAANLIPHSAGVS